MTTEPLPTDESELPDGELDRLFVLGHRWALETGAEVAVHVVSADGAELVQPGSLIVATAPALIACKLHAFAGRRSTRASKRESDALDLVRLVGDLVRSTQDTGAFAGAPFDLTSLVSGQIDRWFVEESLRTARLAGSATAGRDRVEPADVATIGGLFIEALDAPDRGAA